MDLEEKLLFQRQSARLAELETWLGMLLVRHGVATMSGWRYTMCAEHAGAVRTQMPRGQVTVSIEYDEDRDCHVLDAL